MGDRAGEPAGARAGDPVGDRARVEGSTARRGEAPPRWLAPLLLGLLTVALGLAFPYSEATRNANERPRLLQGMALVDCGSWAIDGPAARRLAPGPDVSRSPIDGRVVPNKPPGASVVAAVAYRLTRATSDAPTLRLYTLWARLLGGLVPTLLLAWFCLRRFAPTFGAAPTAAAIALYALATPAASYAHLFYGHQLTAALLGVGTILVIDGARARRPGKAALGGLLAGASVTVEYAAAFAGLPIAVALALLLRRGGRPAAPAIVAAIAGAMLPIIALGAYHRAVFGAALATGYHHVVNPEFAAKHGQGLLGLTAPSLAGFVEQILSPATGLVGWAPLAFVGLVGLVTLARAGRSGGASALARVLAPTLALFLVLAASLSFSGGWRVGPRYLVAILPALIPGLAYVLSDMSRRTWLVGLVAALATYSAIINGLAANLWPHIDPTHVRSPVAEVLLPLLELGAQPWTVTQVAIPREGSADLWWVAVVGASALLCAGPLVWLVRRRRAGIVALALGTVVGVGLVAATTWVTPHPRGRQNLRYILQVWEPPAVGEAPRSAPLRPLPMPGRCR